MVGEGETILTQARSLRPRAPEQPQRQRLTVVRNALPSANQGVRLKA